MAKIICIILALASWSYTFSFITVFWFKLDNIVYTSLEPVLWLILALSAHCFHKIICLLEKIGEKK